MAMKFNRSFNIQRLIKRIIFTIMSLFIGGIILQYYVIAMNGTCSPFYNGLSLIGVTVGSSTCSTTGATNANTITSPTLSASVLSVVGIIAIGGILLTEFVSW